MRRGAPRKLLRGLQLAVITMSVAACGGGSNGSSSPVPATSYTIGGTVNGLDSSGLRLQDNAGDELSVSAAGAFTFAQALTMGTVYSVTVSVQPSAPAQDCVIVNGSGTVAGKNVTTVEVDCAPPQLTTLTNQPPEPGYLALLLTDGSVMMQSGNGAGVFYKLTPDSTGSYINGIWRQLASPPSGYAPQAGAEAVLADGRVLFVGGEYN